ncbi:cysteine-rich receptor-like protein kinase 42 [Cornus florida]|uniref:cysteine-rich receptor-like protein kinase 42 n=1 Tax=Cornus florida TaxID=4283 RepID=UPI00289AAAB3|nr:cysteine-rich receptor-like protein kinase 42 [Cornus florida]
MDEEMQSLYMNQTWKLVQLPKEKMAIGCKWVYTKKEGSSGQDSVRFKARLVAKGYAQKEGIDYNEVFSPVVKHSSIRILLALVAQFDLELAQVDVRTAFLHGDLEEEIYISQPNGFKVAGKENWVYKLKKSLYGLKQSPRQWYKRFDQFMKRQQYTRSHFNHCVYFRKLRDGLFVYLLLYVDDMLIASKNKVEIDKLKIQLSTEFEMKDLGEAKKILGMEIKRDRMKDTVCLSQKQYLKKVLHQFDVGLKFERDDRLGQHLVGYVDSDYAGDLDKRRSTIGYVFTLVKGLVHHSRTKHIDVRFHFVYEILDEGDILLQKIGTTDNPADMLTKGKLEDGREIAVKKLLQSLNQWKKEFTNEAKLLARVQHRYVVTLLGYCTHGAEKLLVYQYVANESLDKLLFDFGRKDALDWKRRYDIIAGVARGLLYLHEDSHYRIIHRDIKASNILLDDKWAPKIADFGNDINTRVAGTSGYMAPGYIMHGYLSVKTDVFSFGVLVLELVSGRKNSAFNPSLDSHNLPEWAFKLYKEGNSLEVMDPALVPSAVPDQVAKCIQIGLLCTQADPHLRPTMRRVVVSLSKELGTLEEPIRPGRPGSGYRRSRRPNSSSSTAGTSGDSSSHTLGSTTNTESATATASTSALTNSRSTTAIAP